MAAYDQAIRAASWRGQRTISDDTHLDDLYTTLLLAAHLDPETD